MRFTVLAVLSLTGCAAANEEVRLPRLFGAEAPAAVPAAPKPELLVDNHFGRDAMGALSEDELKKILAAKKADDRLVFFMADDKTNYGMLVAALDGARQAGADPLGMMTEPLEGQVTAPPPGGAPAPGTPAPPNP